MEATAASAATSAAALARVVVSCVLPARAAVVGRCWWISANSRLVLGSVKLGRAAAARLVVWGPASVDRQSRRASTLDGPSPRWADEPVVGVRGGALRE